MAKNNSKHNKINTKNEQEMDLNKHVKHIKKKINKLCKFATTAALTYYRTASVNIGRSIIISWKISTSCLLYLKNKEKNQMVFTFRTTQIEITFIKSSAICMKSFSTLSASLAEVSKKYMLCLTAKSSPTVVGISLSSLSILFPTNILSTLVLAYSSISLSQSGKQSKVG